MTTITIEETDARAFLRIINGLIADGYTLTKTYTERRFRDLPIANRGWFILLVGVLEKNPLVTTDVRLEFNFGPVSERTNLGTPGTA